MLDQRVSAEVFQKRVGPLVVDPISHRGVSSRHRVMAAYQAIESVVLVIDLRFSRVGLGSLAYLSQPIAMVPGVRRIGTRNGVRPASEIPFVVVEVSKTSRCGHPIVARRRKTIGVPISVGIVTIRFVCSASVACALKLVVLVVVVRCQTVEGRLDGCQSRQRVVRICVRIEIRRPLLVGNAAKAIGCVVCEVGGCHRVRSTGALKTRNLGPLTQCIVGHGHPFWEHLVAGAIRGWHRIEPLAIPLSGRVVAGFYMIPLPLFLLNREVGPRSRTHGVASRIASGGDRYRHEDVSRIVGRTPEKRRILAQRQECRGRHVDHQPAVAEEGEG